MNASSLRFARWSMEDSALIDVLIAQCGFEPRARHASSELAARIETVCAFDYEGQRVHDYATNRAHFEEVGRVISEGEVNWSDSRSVLAALRHLISTSAAPVHRRIHLAVDISSCDRQRIATLSIAAAELCASSDTDVSFLYSSGDYETAADEMDEPVMVNSPIIGLEGWSSDPDRPLRCLLGLGYEGRRALAAVETLEPASTVAYVASGPDARFIDKVEHANHSILGKSATPVVRYNLDDPLSLLTLLAGQVSSALQSSRVVLVPLGPKVFALCASVVSIMTGPDTSVWRVSSGDAANPQPRRATGPIYGFTMRDVAP